MDKYTLEFDFTAPLFDPGDPRIPGRVRSKFEVQDIPVHHLAEGKGPCWIWTASRHKYGYGYVRYQQKCNTAHRVMYMLLVGDPPPGLDLDHLCRNPACCNPAHLEAVSHQVNCQRGEQTALPSHCKNGHPLTEGNYYKSHKQRHCKICHLNHTRNYYFRMKEAKKAERIPSPTS